MRPTWIERVPCLVDANVLLPVLAEGHPHHPVATAWWQACADDDVGLCLPVRMAILRLLTNVRVMGSGTLRPVQALDVLDQLMGDPRVVVLEQPPPGHAAHWRTNVARREPTPNLWTDAWLAAWAQAGDLEMVTFDRGFRSFSKLRLKLLVPAA